MIQQCPQGPQGPQGPQELSSSQWLHTNYRWLIYASHHLVAHGAPKTRFFLIDKKSLI